MEDKILTWKKSHGHLKALLNHVEWLEDKILLFIAEIDGITLMENSGTLDRIIKSCLVVAR